MLIKRASTIYNPALTIRPPATGRQYTVNALSALLTGLPASTHPLALKKNIRHDKR
jgi:hypothetical protein